MVESRADGPDLTGVLAGLASTAAVVDEGLGAGAGRESGPPLPHPVKLTMASRVANLFARTPRTEVPAVPACGRSR